MYNTHAKMLLLLMQKCFKGCKNDRVGSHVDRSQSLFYFVPQESHSQAGSTSPVSFSCRWGSKTTSREKGRFVSKPTNVIVRLSLVSLTSLTWFSVDLQFIQGWELTMSVDKKLCKSCLFWHIFILSPKLVCKSVELDLTLQSHWLVGLHTEIA